MLRAEPGKVKHPDALTLQAQIIQGMSTLGKGGLANRGMKP